MHIFSTSDILDIYGYSNTSFIFRGVYEICFVYGNL